ncbi:MAG: IS21 family transposase, partial [Olsenella sp.]|nr:IS21 family transposase [Olsenella sp.]
AFMGCVGFRTRLCKPRHPLAKGKVERLIRFVKGNFLAGRDFTDITTLNGEALLWCAEQAGRWRRAVACVPSEEHASACLPAARPLEVTDEVALWLCPSRRITFDGFVSYEGRRFGVPYWYERRDCRVSREGGYLHIYSDDLALELAVHAVTWDRHDSWCEGQWADAQPEELPSQPVTTSISQVELAPGKPAFAKFDFGRWA